MTDPDVCPTCASGKAEGSTVSLPNECCAIYFYGMGSPEHRDWVSFVKAAPLTAKLSATEQMMADSVKEIAYWKARALKAEAPDDPHPGLATRMKAWEEEWRLDDEGIRLPDDRGFPVTIRGPWTTHEQERLASAAPDLVRVLLAIEWDGPYGRCPICCESSQPHDPDCRLDAALKKAGVR